MVLNLSNHNNHNNWESHIEVAIYLNIIPISDIISISSVNKSFYNFTKPFIKKYIQRLYNILQKCKQVQVLSNIGSLYSFYNEPGRFHYTNDYWYKIFDTKLNPNELSIYYAYFVKLYKYHTKQEMGNEFWMAHIFEDGFIKSFASRLDGSVRFMNNSVNKYYDRCIMSKSYYEYNSYYDAVRCFRVVTDGPFYKSKIDVTYEYLSPVNKKLFEKLVVLFYNSTQEHIDNMTYDTFYKSINV